METLLENRIKLFFFFFFFFYYFPRDAIEISQNCNKQSCVPKYGAAPFRQSH